MSRRSELRACQEQVVQIAKQLEHSTALHARLDRDRVEQEALVASSVATFAAVAGRLADGRHQTAASRSRLERVTDEEQRVKNNSLSTEKRIADLRSEVAAADEQQLSLEAALKLLHARLEADTDNLTKLQEQQLQAHAHAVDRQVAAAKCEQRVEMLRQQMDLAQRSRQERDRALDEARARFAAYQRQLVECENHLLVGRQTLAELFLHKDRHVHELVEQNAAVDLLRAERVQLAEQVREHRKHLDALQMQQHKLEVATTKRRHELQTLCERMQDDYGIDLAAEAESREQGSGSEEHEG
jgi:chromosome segregation ATPase